MPDRYVNMSEERYREVIAEWHRVHGAYRGTGRVNASRKTNQEQPPDPNMWREKQENLKFQER